MPKPKNNMANISAVTSFVPQQSDIKNNYYVFSYVISIENISDEPSN